MRYIKLYEDWNDYFEIPQSIPQALKNAKMNLVKIFGLGEKNLYANAEEMKEIEKVKKYFKWWYSDPKVISKLNVKGDKNSLTEEHFKHKGWNDMELRKLSEFTYLLDLDTICHDHQNIVSNFDIDEKNLA